MENGNFNLLTALDEVQQLGLQVPVMRASKFAEAVGCSASAITSAMDRGEIPYVQLTPARPGKRPTRYINLVAIAKLCKEAAA
ncbi:hypothetical protein QKW35_06045 [Pontibacterium granulatum]|uniref:hypothetical protein n=1 Tax=Pontibacterium granulatum TaxID=2036029 RepID=UPI00249CCA1E|nr:hypothetical protein [Pontibacterium granulatum]MDI3323930.1 hypothetical protein [Pontibacterium granulatum]